MLGIRKARKSPEIIKIKSSLTSRNIGQIYPASTGVSLREDYMLKRYAVSGLWLEGMSTPSINAMYR